MSIEASVPGQFDPFPRKPGAVFVQPPEQPVELSPFAALARASNDAPDGA
jgi:hypothetical protein